MVELRWVKCGPLDKSGMSYLSPLSAAFGTPAEYWKLQYGHVQSDGYVRWRDVLKDDEVAVGEPR